MPPSRVDGASASHLLSPMPPNRTLYGVGDLPRMEGGSCGPSRRAWWKCSAPRIPGYRDTAPVGYMRCCCVSVQWVGSIGARRSLVGVVLASGGGPRLAWTRARSIYHWVSTLSCQANSAELSLVVLCFAYTLSFRQLRSRSRTAARSSSRSHTPPPNLSAWPGPVLVCASGATESAQRPPAMYIQPLAPAARPPPPVISLTQEQPAVRIQIHGHCIQYARRWRRRSAELGTADDSLVRSRRPWAGRPGRSRSKAEGAGVKPGSWTVCTSWFLFWFLLWGFFHRAVRLLRSHRRWLCCAAWATRIYGARYLWSSAALSSALWRSRGSSLAVLMPACAVALCCRHRAAIPLGLQMSLPVLPRILDRPRAVWYVKPLTSRAAQADLPRSGSLILDDDVASRAGLLLSQCPADSPGGSRGERDKDERASALARWECGLHGCASVSLVTSYADSLCAVHLPLFALILPVPFRVLSTWYGRRCYGRGVTNSPLLLHFFATLLNPLIPVPSDGVECPGTFAP